MRLEFPFIEVISKHIYRISLIELFPIFCDYARAVIDIRQVEGEGDRRNASRNRSNRAGTSLLFSFGQLPRFEFHKLTSIVIRNLAVLCSRSPLYKVSAWKEAEHDDLI